MRHHVPNIKEKPAAIEKIDTEMLFEKAPLAMFIVNRDRRLIQYNEAAAAMAGRVEKTALGLRGGEFFHCVTAFDHPKGCGFSNACAVCIVRKTVLDTFETGLEHRSVEASIPVKNEKGIHKTWVLLSTAIVNFGEEEGVLICMKDITERKRAEEALRQSERKFRLVTETIENVFWMSTCGVGEMLYISPAYERLWEKSRESLYRSPKSFMEAIHPDDREMYSNVLTQYHNVGKSYKCEYRIVKRDGRIRWICEKGYPVLHQSDKVNLMSGVCTDITELKRTEEALREKNDELLLKAEKLRERNIALKVLLENRDQEKRQQAEKLTRNFDRLVFPYFEKLKSCKDREGRRTLLEIIESNTQDCLSSEKPSHHSFYREFTPMEVQVADLIKSGKTSKEIAVLLNISPRSVYFHRNNLRRKLNISKTGTNLRTFLTTHHKTL